MTTPMSPGTAKHRFTVADFHRMGEVGIFGEHDRVELIGGEVFGMTPISSRHAACVKRLNAVLVTRVGSRALVGVQDPIRVDSHSEPQPDIALLRPSPDTYASAHPGAADVLLVVEVAESSLVYDRGPKADLYAGAGIPEAWIVDLDGESVEVLREPGVDGYARRSTYGRGELLAPAAFPEVSIAVDSILP